MSDLVEFLRARWDEAEQAAKAATNGPWLVVNVTDYGTATVDGPDALQDGGYDDATKTRKQVMRPRTVIPQDVDYGSTVGRADAEHIARHDPAQVLAEVEAKRRMISEHGHDPMNGCRRCADGTRTVDGRVIVNPMDWPCTTLRLLALPYADHADYDESWRP